MLSKCSVIIVTHNSEKYIDKAVDSVKRQTAPAQKIIIVDSGSLDPSYLDKYKDIKVAKYTGDVGFCKGNNYGMQYVDKNSEFVFFLNPDAILTDNFLEQAVNYMNKSENKRVGAITGTTLGYDIDKDQPTGLYDTTGIFQKWYGKWYDRAQGEAVDKNRYQTEDNIDAICGAVYFCRKDALDTIKLRKNEIFDSSFFMYKEDIDLSLRLQSKGWQIKFVPNLICYHCRGWAGDRSKMKRRYRLCSARNELRINNKPIPKLYSLVKYIAVKVFDY